MRPNSTGTVPKPNCLRWCKTHAKTSSRQSLNSHARNGSQALENSNLAVGPGGNMTYRTCWTQPTWLEKRSRGTSTHAPSKDERCTKIVSSKLSFLLFSAYLIYDFQIPKSPPCVLLRPLEIQQGRALMPTLSIFLAYVFLSLTPRFADQMGGGKWATMAHILPYTFCVYLKTTDGKPWTKTRGYDHSRWGISPFFLKPLPHLFFKRECLFLYCYKS